MEHRNHREVRASWANVRMRLRGGLTAGGKAPMLMPAMYDRGMGAAAVAFHGAHDSQSVRFTFLLHSRGAITGLAGGALAFSAIVLMAHVLSGAAFIATAGIVVALLLTGELALNHAQGLQAAGTRRGRRRAIRAFATDRGHRPAKREHARTRLHAQTTSERPAAARHD